MFGLYLAKEGEKAKEMVNGVALYATPWSKAKNKGSQGFYQKMLGKAITKSI